MKAITCDVILEGASTRADGSLTLRFSTPELDAPSKTAFLELLNKNLKVLLQPRDNEPVELHEVKKEFDRKTDSQRMRGLLFVWWRHLQEPGEFEHFYHRRMEDMMTDIKKELPQQ